MSFNLMYIQQLDINIEHYANKLFKRVGGKLETIMHDAVRVSDLTLYMKCYKRATNKYTKQIKQGD